MQIFDFYPTTRVVYGENTIDQLGELVKEFNAKRILIVTDPGIVKAGHVEKTLASLKKVSLEASVFQDVQENPTTRIVEKGVEFANEIGQVDFLVGLGGGSAMDCAKGINFLLTNGGRMEDYWGTGKAAKPMLPSIGIPTTAGTGSEAQSYALISQEETHIKMACGDMKARFRVVILDPVLARSVPRPVAVATGIDAVSHAIESYVTTKRNPISQMFAREAWRLLEKNFDIVLNDSDNIEAWGHMLLGAHFAGAAIENSMLGAAHACANPLTARFDVTHGVAVGIMLPYVIKFNSTVVNGSYRELGRILHASNGFPNDDEKQLLKRVDELTSAANIPKRLKDLEIDKSELSVLAKDAATQWTGQFNPRPVGEAELLAIYETAY